MVPRLVPIRRLHLLPQFTHTQHVCVRVSLVTPTFILRFRFPHTFVHVPILFRLPLPPHLFFYRLRYVHTTYTPFYTTPHILFTFFTFCPVHFPLPVYVPILRLLYVQFPAFYYTTPRSFTYGLIFTRSTFTTFATRLRLRLRSRFVTFSSHHLLHVRCPTYSSFARATYHRFIPHHLRYTPPPPPFHSDFTPFPTFAVPHHRHHHTALPRSHRSRFVQFYHTYTPHLHTFTYLPVLRFAR